MGMLNFTSIVLFPTLLHDLRGYPDNAIATLIAARGVGNWTAFLVIVQFTRMAPRLAIVCGMAIQATAGFWMAQWDINLTDADVFWGNFLLGFGQSIAFTPMTVMAFSTLPPRPGDGGVRRLYPDAQFRLEPVHFHRRADRQPLDRGQLFADDGVHHALQQDPVGAGPAVAVESGQRNQPASASPTEMLRQAAMIGYLNAFYPDGLRRPCRHAAGRLDAPGSRAIREQWLATEV